MLKVLAKQLSDCFLLKALYDNMTFKGAEETERPVKSEMEASAMLLGVRTKVERDSIGADLEGNSDGEDGEEHLETDDVEDYSETRF